VTPELRFSDALCPPPKSDSQTLATLGTAGVDHGAAAASLHANQEAVRACATNLGWLVSAFHIKIPKIRDGNPPAGNAAELRSCLP
jgi:hypothetical protein